MTNPNLFQNEEKGILKYIPAGQSPKIYTELIGQLLGTTKDGQPRPHEDLLYFLYVAKRTGLDPMTRQIYAVYRWDYRTGKERMVIQTGIDGMRLSAQRSKEYAGQDDAKFFPEDESSEHPIKATVTVYRLNKITGDRMPVTATARWNEYAQLDKEGKPTAMWTKMPYTMLAKCAESLALRKGFPNELAGIYAEEEMNQSVVVELPTPQKFEKKEEIVATPELEQKPIDIVARRKELQNGNKD